MYNRVVFRVLTLRFQQRWNDRPSIRVLKEVLLSCSSIAGEQVMQYNKETTVTGSGLKL